MCPGPGRGGRGPPHLELGPCRPTWPHSEPKCLSRARPCPSLGRRASQGRGLGLSWWGPSPHVRVPSAEGGVVLPTGPGGLLLSSSLSPWLLWVGRGPGQKGLPDGAEPRFPILTTQDTLTGASRSHDSVDSVATACPCSVPVVLEGGDSVLGWPHDPSSFPGGLCLGPVPPEVALEALVHRVVFRGDALGSGWVLL